ncbi:MAG: dicarboxylate/amino acid:cation symporter [Synergistaceae bacterium]|nr:dicarboxylate/amino acid:cation symporter [Synergistaceae bacterium]MBQ7068921.1 dicarboxylate/amino acid:cation symporter [Synergistaceae bacterium]MBR0076440.1 dicarboxylate/amino acid:cation symporter [Synergistaceae bacterium]MBR0079275.1 dicarboxylate/amino acid:cation symporter [Synergistaceae bacterium]MBR0232652.1 dicarboxylate/amino acid:cation symporter [Synergistaceae bacterium]
MVKKFEFNPSDKDKTISEILNYVHETVRNFKMKSINENQVILMFEESLLSLINNSESDKTFTIKTSIKRFLDTLNIEITVPGREFEFAEEISSLKVEDDDDDSKSAIQNLLLRSFGNKLKYKHKNGLNSIKIEAVKSPYSFLYKTLTAVFFAVVCGIICRYFVPEKIYMILNDNILEAVRDMFMNGIKIVVAPIVFFSIVNSVSQFNNFSEIGKMGGKFMTLFLIMEFTACVLSGLVFYAAMFAGFPFSEILAHGSEVSTFTAGSFSIKNLIVNIIPSNFVNPFLKSDMLQLMALGILCGLAIGSIGDYSKTLKNSFSAWDELFRKITSMITRFIPFAVFCSIWSMFLTTGAELLFSLFSIIVIVFTGMILILCVDCLRLKFKGLSVSKFLSKTAFAMAHVFSTTSSSVSLPENMKAAEKLGVPSKIYSFSMPLSVIFSKNGSIFYRATTALLMAKIFGVEISFFSVISVLISASIITLATPGVPGGAYIAFSALLAQLGVSSEALACIIGVDAVMDIFIGVINSFGAIVSTVTISKDSGMLNQEIYESKV